jgi:hypothetical protein
MFANSTDVPALNRGTRRPCGPAAEISHDRDHTGVIGPRRTPQPRCSAVTKLAASALRGPGSYNGPTEGE